MSSVKVRAALENALAGMAPLLAAATISTSSIATSTVITTAAAHGLVSNLYVTIAGHTGSTPSINGIYKATKIGANTFSIPVAVTVAGTGGTVTANLTAWENTDFAPITGIPYQVPAVHFAKPDNPEMGASYFELGFLQVNLAYPSQTGAGAAGTRAELIRTTFKRGNTFAYSGVTVRITGTPQILKGYPDSGVWVVPVRIPFMAQVTV